ncbi:MAG: glycosyltransferase family 4 protein [Ignavibacteria bacterium]
MKLLVVAFGHTENVLTLCKELSKKIVLHLCFIFSGDRVQNGILELDLSKFKYGLNTDSEIIKHLPVEIQNFIDNSFSLSVIRTPHRKVFKDFTFTNFRLLRKSFRKLTKEFDFDIVHYNGLSGFLLYLPLFLHGKARFWTLHDAIPHTGDENVKTKILNKLLSRYDFFFVQHYKYLRDKFIENFRVKPEKVFQLYSGPLNVYRNFESDERIVNGDYILFYGRIAKYKGIDYLLKAYNKLKTDVKLVIAGSGRLWSENEIIDSNKNIIFLNKYIETRELVSLIKNSLFVVAPYTDATHSAVVVTSYVFGKPIIAYNVGGLSEVIQNNFTGILVEPNSVDALSVAIENLLCDKERIKEMGKNIGNFLNDRLNWEEISNGYYKMYKSIFND